METADTYRSAWQASPLAIVTLDDQGCVRSCNPASEQLFDQSTEALRGARLSELAHPLDRGAVQQMVTEALAGRRPARQEIRFARPQERLIVTGFSVAPAGASTDNGAVCVLRDLSQEKALRPQLLHTERMASIGTVASVVAHELNNALAGALGCLQLLPPSSDPAVQELLDSLDQELHRSAEIVRELKGYARAEDGLSDQIDLNTLLGRLETLLRFKRSGPACPLELAIDEDVPVMVGNGNQLLQALLNLVSNAEQAVVDQPEERRVIRIGARATAQVVIIEVIDRGPGVPEALRARLFEPFYSTKAAGEGTGLGLTVVQAVAAGHGGRVELDDTFGGGATFRMVLPRTTPTPTERSPAPDRPNDQQQVLQGARILVADDEPILRRVIQRACTEWGMQAVCVRTADEACDALEQQDFELAILDVRMPGGGGAKVFRRLSSDHPHLIPRTVFMSGELSDEMSDIVGQGYAGLLHKPFDLDALLDVLVEAMNGPGPDSD